MLLQEIEPINQWKSGYRSKYMYMENVKNVYMNVYVYFYVNLCQFTTIYARKLNLSRWIIIIVLSARIAHRGQYLDR